MKILLLSAYNTQSHNYWSTSMMAQFPEYDWTFLTLPPRKFSWRIRGNALSWAAECDEILNRDYDSVIATSMVDFSTLLGLYPHLSTANTIYYFHENQFEYPLSMEKQHTNVESMMVNLYSALAAKMVLFNSQFNRDTFFSGAEKLLKRINDHSPISILERIRLKSDLLPVPICSRVNSDDEKIQSSLIWNHRWEYDKNPEDYYETLKLLKADGIDFKLIFMGIQFKNSPAIFNKIKEDFKEEILCWGEQSKSDYHYWLKKGQYIISTAIHEFQGLAVMEGVQNGAIPIVPNRLSYPEWFSKEYLFGNTPQEMADHIKQLFITPSQIPDIDILSWDNLKSMYRDKILGV